MDLHGSPRWVRIALVAERNERRAERASRQLALLEELKAAATRVGFAVREERLLREVGYHVRSGSCRVGEQQIILLDRGLQPSAQIDILVEELATCRLDDVYLSPAARDLVERAASVRPAAVPAADASSTEEAAP